MLETTNMTASCDCGAVEVSITAAPIAQFVCHCSDCRNFSGEPYVGAVFFRPEDVNVRGELEYFTEKGGSGFDKTYCSCASCHAWLYSTIVAMNGAIAFGAHRLTPFNFEPQAHVWTSEKAEHVQIPSEIMQSSKIPPKEILDVMIASFWGEK